MGQNRRYDSTGGDIERAAARYDRRPAPVGLTIDQVRSTGRRSDAATPVGVIAWVTHHVSYAEPLHVEAEAIAWTSGAVLIRWTPEGDTQPVHAWVWANAVQRR